MSIHEKTMLKMKTNDLENVPRHEAGIVAAKYDQPGYVHAMKLVAKDDI